MSNIAATLVLEILGRPKEHVKKALEELVDKLGAERGVKLISKKIHEPIPVEKSKDLFTTFSELEVEFASIENYLGVLFAYMPSNIDIVSPPSFAISNVQLNDIGNKLIQRLHEYDAITKNVLVERETLINELKKSAPLLFQKKEPEKRAKKK
ncbi:hypothetical protein HY450_01220 [Candidatus Pacearchaeota archaeon]|nr:hypothetical protein [Candidatus Pacearchaeota archaeon]